MSAHTDSPRGILAGASAFLAWGLSAIYWKALAHVPAYEILCHRIVWSLAFTALLLLLRGGLGETLGALKNRRTLALLAASAALVSVNWFLFIWAVTAGYVLETSLGYYLTPQVNVLLGCLVLGERPRRLQWAALGLACAGVLNMVLLYGEFPWVAVGLAASFGLYGLVRKVVAVGPLPGLFVETALASVPAVAWLASVHRAGGGAFGALGTGTDALLLGAGVLTTLPLLCFTFAARRITMVTLGLLQYIAPTCFFLLGTLAYHEPFTTAHAATFALIWAGIGLFVVEGVILRRRERRALGG
ncbi:MAG: EamA family transporter RarD [Desulfovibrionaceae bacterium]